MRIYYLVKWTLSICTTKIKRWTCTWTGGWLRCEWFSQCFMSLKLRIVSVEFGKLFTSVIFSFCELCIRLSCQWSPCKIWNFFEFWDGKLTWSSEKLEKTQNTKNLLFLREGLNQQKSFGFSWTTVFYHLKELIVWLTPGASLSGRKSWRFVDENSRNLKRSAKVLNKTEKIVTNHMNEKNSLKAIKL